MVIVFAYSAVVPKSSLHIQLTRIFFAMSLRANIDKVLLKLAYLIISRNTPKLSKKFPKLVCFSFDYIGNYINTYGRYENALLEKLREVVLRQGALDTVLDIGANIGNHTVFFSEIFKRVIAFEPNPRTFSLLSINTSNLQNVSCLMLGASSKKATLNFHVDELNMGDSRISSENTPKEGDNHSITTIDVMPIDAIDEINSENVSLVKIDVQGHEIEVIRGMLDTLRRTAPIIAFEQEAVEIVDGSSEVIKQLRDVGYSYFYTIEHRRSIVGNNLPSFLRVPFVLLEILIRGDNIDNAEFLEITSLEKRQYNMLIASMRHVELK